MAILAYLVLFIYTGALLYITVYCVLQFHMLYAYQRPSQDELKRHKMVEEMGEQGHEWPFVTIQLPIFNEKYVVDRLVDNIMLIDYPKDCFEVHVLDDSTDETVDYTKARVDHYKALGFNIEQVRRSDRKGYKAGALKEGMQHAKGNYIAIFDADFMPKPDFLKRTIPYFQDPEVGVVQTRWEHINEDYSLITRLQALQLNVHFTVEQAGRMRAGHMLQFNGTAGIWRRETIESAGGWEADTLTEDFDLSIRAQLKGWRIHFLEEVGSPAELPAEMNSFKAQQFRWMKGGAETAKKMLPVVWQSNLPFTEKFHTTMHLLGSTVFVFVLITGLFSVPLLFFMSDLIQMGISKNFFAYFMIGMLSIVSIYYVANVQSPIHRDADFSKQMVKFVLLFPLFLALSMGLSLHNTVAVIQGYRGKKSPFVRTPKFNIQNIKDSFNKGAYLSKKLSWTTILEGVLALYFLLAILGGLMINHTTFIIFHLMLFIGFGTIFFFSVRHLNAK